MMMKLLQSLNLQDECADLVFLSVPNNTNEFQQAVSFILSSHFQLSSLTLFIILLIHKNFLLNIVTSIRFLSMIVTLALHISHNNSSLAVHFFKIKIFNGRRSL